MSDDWRVLISEFARLTRDSTIATGFLSQHLRLDSVEARRVLAPAEVTVAAMITAGFDPGTAARGLAFVSDFAFASARNSLLRQGGGHQQRDQLRTALAHDGDGGGLPELKHLVESEIDWLDAQFEFDLRIFLIGMDAELSSAR